MPDFDDPVFGRLKFDPDLKWYTGSVSNALGVTGDVEISISATPESIDSKAAVARNTLLLLKDAYPSILDRTIGELLPIRNESWREDEDPVISADEFRNQLTLEALEFNEPRTTVWLECADLFWGHGIEIRLEPGLENLEACVAG